MKIVEALSQSSRRSPVCSRQQRRLPRTIDTVIVVDLQTILAAEKVARLVLVVDENPLLRCVRLVPTPAD